MTIKRVGILPWVKSGDLHQQLFKEALIRQNFECVELEYHKGLPISIALKNAEFDLLILDWVHSFYVSKELIPTVIKTVLGVIDRAKIKGRSIPIIWNMHNLHRHDEVHVEIEKFSFKKLSKSVDGIRVFNTSSIKSTIDYLCLPSSFNIKAIEQGPYPVNKGDKSQILIDLDIDISKKVLLFFGNIREGKGLVDFVKVFNNVNDDEVVLVIAGKSVNDDISNCIKKITEGNPSIKLIDSFIPEEDVANFFDLGDYVVLPYKQILNSGVLVLAKSYNKPIIANNIDLFVNEIRDSDSIITDLFNEKCLEEALDVIVKKESMNPKVIDNNLVQDWDIIVNKVVLFGSQLAVKYAK